MLVSSPIEVAPRFSCLGEAVESAARSGAHLWLGQGDQPPARFSYRQLVERAHLAAHNLLALGLEPGDRVLLMLPTSEAWLVAFFGTLFAGGVAVPLGPVFSFGGLERYARTIRHIALDSGARFFVGTPAVEPYLPLLREDNPALREFIRPERLSEPLRNGPLLPSASPEDLAVLQYTSGTTGLPKGVMLSHRAVLANAFMIGQRVSMSPNDVGVSWLPLFHDMGLVGALMTSVYWHYPLFLLPPESFLLHPRRWLQAISCVRATLTVAPNFAYQMAVDRIGDRHLRELRLDSLRCAFNGSEPVRPATLRAFTARFAACGLDTRAVLPVYGMAENTLAATSPAAGEHWISQRLDRAGLELGARVSTGCPGGSGVETELVSVGTPLAGVSVAVRGVSGEDLPPRSVGEVVLKSPSIMDGYWGKPEETGRVLRDGWLRTGDLGFIHEGRLYLTGRVKELIIKRGRNHYPEEIEQLASEVGGRRVLQAAAFSSPNERSGTEDIVLVVEARALSSAERQELEQEINGALIGVLGVGADVVVFVPPHSIPRTTSGKIQRSVLRERYQLGELGTAADRDEGLC